MLDPDLLEQRTDALKGVGVAAAQDGQRASFGARNATGDRRVDVANTGVRFDLGESPHSRDRVAAEIDVNVTCGRPSENAICPCDRGFDLGRTWERREDDGAS